MTPPTFSFLCRFFEQLANDQLVEYKKFSSKAALRSGWLKDLHKIYEEQTKPAIKKVTTEGNNALLDRHKVAAAMVMGVLRSQPFVEPSSCDAIPHRYWEATTILAVGVGAVIVLLFGVAEANDTNNADLAAIYGDEVDTDLLGIATGNGDGSYENQLVKAISFARRGGQSVPDGYALLISHIFFLAQGMFERRRCGVLKIDPDGSSMNLRDRMKRIETLPDSF
jgi:hypothetical protein